MKSIGMPASAGGSGRAPVAADADIDTKNAANPSTRRAKAGRTILTKGMVILSGSSDRAVAVARLRRPRERCRPAFFGDADCNRLAGAFSHGDRDSRQPSASALGPILAFRWP